MSSRQARTLRRQAERKAVKLARKAAKAANGFVFSYELEPSNPPIPNPEQPNGPTISAAQLAANRQNAQYSTGPTSAAGKLASSRNSLKHGLASSTLIIPGEDPADFEALQSALLEEHQPATPAEQLLVDELAQSWWLTKRAIRLQNQCFTENGVDEKRLSLLLRYQTTHQRAFHRALTTLLRLQKQRRQQQIGFVSQNRQFLRPNSSIAGFVSQETPIESSAVNYETPPLTRSISQSRYSATPGSLSRGAQGAKSLSFAAE